eukprot:TRINITY_DN9517_c0_g1_i1.p1 TRINITY_DN9517_c0_g1~~TRINITY_DN9517_c0_g1_i1.p1  ORF type:complete len:190 (+),score=32.17 TRINITY_DN9517_c0_g1_i1:106-675(+)
MEKITNPLDLHAKITEEDKDFIMQCVGEDEKLLSRKEQFDLIRKHVENSDIERLKRTITAKMDEVLDAENIGYLTHCIECIATSETIRKEEFVSTMINDVLSEFDRLLKEEKMDFNIMREASIFCQTLENGCEEFSNLLNQANSTLEIQTRIRELKNKLKSQINEQGKQIKKAKNREKVTKREESAKKP